MTRKKIQRTLTPTGHGLMHEGAPHNAAGRLMPGMGYVRSSGKGRAKCRCGALSETLPTGAARKRWHAQHKQDIINAAKGPTVASEAAVKAFPDTEWSQPGTLAAMREAYDRGAADTVPTREALVAWMHSRQEFEYDECDHGFQSGSWVKPGEKIPYAMCERWADALLESGLLSPEKKI